MNNKYKGIFMLSCGLSIVALIIAVVALCRTCPRTVSLSFDYLGVIIGVLSVLVTVVIGWNIYSILDIKSLQLEFDSKIKNVQNDIDNKFYKDLYTGLKQTHLSFANSYAVDLSRADAIEIDNTRVFLFLCHQLSALLYHCKIDQAKIDQGQTYDIGGKMKRGIQKMIDRIDSERDKGSGFKLDSSYRDQLIRLCDKIGDKIPSNDLFEELTEKIKSIPIDQE